MRVTHVSVSGVPVLHRLGGAVQRRVMELARTQARSGNAVTVYSPGDADRDTVCDGVRIRFVRSVVRGPLQALEFQGRVARIVQAEDSPDVLHLHAHPEGPLSFFRCPARKVLSYDYFRFRRASHFPQHQLYGALLRRFDLLLPCSDYCRRESTRYWSLPEDRIRVLYNGVNTKQFFPDPAAGAREREMLGTDKKVVLYVGRLNRQKGTDVLLDAVDLLRRARKDFQLVLAGPIGQFGALAQDDPWADRIQAVGGAYLGAVDEDRLAGVYNMAHVLVMPTREYEMFGMAAVEAEACGKPVIASDHGGLVETVPEGSGLRFPVGDATALAGAISRLLDDHALHRALSAGAVDHARGFSWPRIVQTLDSYYGEALAS